MRQRPFRFFFPALGGLLLAACMQQPPRPSSLPPAVTATPPVPAAAPQPAEPALPLPAEPAGPRPVAPARPPADGSQLSAVKGLLAAADRALARGEVELAAANLERAQRLAPRSALVYQKLAALRLRQRRAAEAEQLARKGLAYAGGPAQQAALWRLIASARKQHGQPAAAREAQARADALEGNALGATP